MISNDSAEPQASPSREAEPGTAEAPVLDPRSPIEVAGGTGPVNDPGATDNKPPGVTSSDLYLLA
jgi:hypothetical protein